MVEKKHAILIMAHDNVGTIETNINILDSENIDFFIHVDKKSNIENFSILEKKSRKSKICFIERIKVNWGAFSQIKAELSLYEAALSKGKYDYFHLISSNDLCIVNKESFLNKFFNEKKNFISIDKNISLKEIRRVKFYYPLQDISFFSRNKVGWGLSKAICIFQSLIRIDRIKNFKIYKGSNWCSLNKEFVEYLISNRNLIYKYFSNGKCADELYKQSIFMKWKNFYSDDDWGNQNLRYIDWEEGGASPKVLDLDDYEHIQKTNAIFCRKVLLNSELSEVMKKKYGQN